MPLLSGPVRLPVDLPYLDRYCTLAGDEDGGVTLECKQCPTGHHRVAYIGWNAPPDVAVVQDITSLIDAGMKHLAEYHPEP